MASDLGKAYVQIIPKAEGISSKISGLLKPGSKKAGEDSGAGIASGIKKAIIGAGIAAPIIGVFKGAMDEGGKLQQSYGGLETIYGDAAAAAKKYASEAAAAGISANDYAEQAVSFGASLKQAFGGDTSKAVEAANTAIMDMTDNAAKMGTPIESIQNAYQGFAKQNYTMLDNLKLGYGGTKTEMQRLLADAQKISGVEYNIDNLGDVYEAVHVIQGELGLTGVAASEASNTFTGSLGAMQAAASNLMGNLALGEDVGPAMETLIGNAVTFVAKNLVPMATTTLKSLPKAIATVIKVGGPIVMQSGKELLDSMVKGIQTNLPIVMNKGSEILTNLSQGIRDHLPEVVSRGVEIVSNIATTIADNLPTVLAKGKEILSNVVTGIAESLPQLSEGAGTLIGRFSDYLYKNMPKIMQKGGELVGQLVSGLIRNLPQIMSGAGRLVLTLTSGIAKAVPQVLKLGINIIKSFVNGLANTASVRNAMNRVKSALISPIESARNTIRGVVNRIKGMFPLSIGRIFSNLKLPHFNISGGTAPFGIGGKGTKPSISVDWYAKGAVFDGPSVIGVAEAGKEAAIPLEGRHMRPFAKAIADEMGGSGQTIIINTTVNGAEDPEDWADRAVREIKLKVRTA